MTAGIFFALLAIPAVAVAAITISLCRSISSIADDTQAIIRNNAETRRNYSRARMENR